MLSTQILIHLFIVFGCRFYTAVNNVLTSVQKTEESLRRLKNLREKTGSASQGNVSAAGMSDDDKIRLQLYVDINAWCKGIEQLGIDSKQIVQMIELTGLVDGFNKTHAK